MKSWDDTVLQDAEQLLREGRIQEARPLLVAYIRKDPSSAHGWWLLSMALSDPKQQIDCLERVLRIDPNNAPARTRLSKLKGGIAPRPFSASFETSPAIKQEAPRSFTPFLPEENEVPHPPHSAPKSPPAKKKANWVLPVSILSVFLCVAAGITGFVIVLGGRQQVALPFISPETQSPLQPGQSLPTLGLPLTWTPTITFTPLPTRTLIPGLSTPDLISILTATDIPNSTMGIASGLEAPDFSLVNINNGERVSLSEHQGHPLILFFFATWCHFCEGETPALQKIYEDFKNDGLVVLAIDVRESAEVARTFRDSNNLTFPILNDADGTVFEKYKGTHFPTNYFVDSNGKVSTFVRGMLDYSTLNIKVRVLLNMIPTPAP